jgi:hypothetical protein
MAKRVDLKETITYEDLLLSNTIEQEALVNLLEAKGVITKSELLEEIRRIKDRQNKGRGR